MNNTELIAKIEEAFKKGEYPGDDQLVYDNSGKHLECMNVKELFKNKDWKNLADGFLSKEQLALNFFSTQAFSYYLPAFMILAIKDYKEADNIPDILLSKFTVPSETDTVVLAHSIKKYGIDQQMSGVDFEYILQNNLKNTDRSIHLFFERVKQFTKSQCETIALFLKYMSENYPVDYLNNEPKRAMERYWFIYE